MKQSMTCSKEHLLSRHNILCMFLYCRCNHTQPPPTGKENMSPMKTRKLYVAQLPSVYCSVCTPSTLGGKVMKGNIMISLLTTKAEEAEERILGPAQKTSGSTLSMRDSSGICKSAVYLANERERSGDAGRGGSGGSGQRRWRAHKEERTTPSSTASRKATPSPQTLQRRGGGGGGGGGGR
jgi:hypothetical protein